MLLHPFNIIAPKEGCLGANPTWCLSVTVAELVTVPLVRFLLIFPYIFILERGRCCLGNWNNQIAVPQHNTLRPTKYHFKRTHSRGLATAQSTHQVHNMALTDLANELLLQIFCSCDALKDAHRLGATCHRLHKISQSVLYTVAEAQLGKSMLHRPPLMMRFLTPIEICISRLK